MENRTLPARKGRKKKVTVPAGPAPCIGFRYTPAEERAIERAKLRARRFMLRFGQGTGTKERSIFDRWYFLKKKTAPRAEKEATADKGENTEEQSDSQSDTDLPEPILMVDPAEYPRVTLDIIVCRIADYFDIQPDDVFGFSDEGAAPKLRALAVWLALNRFGLRRSDVALGFGRLPVAIDEIEKLMKTEIKRHTPFWIEAHRYTEQITDDVYAHFRY